MVTLIILKKGLSVFYYDGVPTFSLSWLIDSQPHICLKHPSSQFVNYRKNLASASDEKTAMAGQNRSLFGRNASG
jgi:hypothetical protein